MRSSLLIPATAALFARSATASSNNTTIANTSDATAPIVDLGYELHQATINTTGNYYNFSNIPYAEPPLGNLRFAAPIAPQSINRTVNTGAVEHICPQASPYWDIIAVENLSGASAAVLAELASIPYTVADIPTPDPRTSEDCLTLDVIVPESIYSSNEAKAPVLVWIFGGGFVGGNSKSAGNPATLIARGQEDGSEGFVYVAMNYRLGLFGWQSGPTFQENGTANVALYDQRLALEWVQENIHLFGGDKDRVTIVGESAGAASILHQITAYGGGEKAPFQQAIAQSPGFTPSPTDDVQEALNTKILETASSLFNKSVTTTQDLRELSTSELQTLNSLLIGNASYGSYTFGPTVDGVFVPELPGILLLDGDFDHNLTVMVGHNSAEGEFFADPFVTDDAEFRSFIATYLPDIDNSTVEYIADTLYPPVLNGTYGYTTTFERTATIVGDVGFVCNTRYLDTAFDNATYSYYFAIPPGLHAEDVAYTFFNGDTTTSDDGLTVNATVAATLQTYITEFVKTGNPNFDGVPTFPLYSDAALTVELSEDEGAVVTDTAATERCAFWQKGLYY